MAAKGGRRYPLIVYTQMMDRWRPWIFWLGVLLLGMAGIVFYWGMAQWRWVTFATVGIFNIFASLLMWFVRNGAYVQLFPAYMRLVTPFLRMNVSYKRFRRSGPSNMGALFPPNRISSAQAEVVQQVAGMTAVVIEFTSHPMSQSAMRFFLSPLFFKDKTPNLVILVEDWMRFSAELDSIRSGGSVAAPPQAQPQQQQKRATSSSILSKLPPKK
jgi:hypothetical protein